MVYIVDSTTTQFKIKNHQLHRKALARSAFLPAKSVSWRYYPWLVNFQTARPAYSTYPLKTVLHCKICSLLKSKAYRLNRVWRASSFKFCCSVFRLNFEVYWPDDAGKAPPSQNDTNKCWTGFFNRLSVTEGYRTWNTDCKDRNLSNLSARAF